MQLTLTELYEAIQEINIKKIEMNNFKSKIYSLSKSDLKEIEEKTFVDLKDINPAFLQNSYYLANLLNSELRIDNLNVLKQIEFTPEVILSCLSEHRCELLKNLPDEKKNEELLNILLTRNIKYPFTNIFKKSTYFESLNTKENTNEKIIKKLLRQHEKNILNISKDLLTDNEIYEYLIRFHNSEESQTGYIFELRNIDWWIENKDIFKLLIQSMCNSHYSNNNKISFNNFDEKNSSHELVALMFAAFSPSLAEKYFKKFGCEMSNVEKYISITSEAKVEYNKLQTWNIYEYLNKNTQEQSEFATNFLKSHLNYLYSLKDHTDRNFQEFKESFQTSIKNVDYILSTLLTSDEKNKHDFYNLTKGNIYLLVLFFVNPSKNTEKEMEKGFRNLDRCLALFDNEREALLNIFSYNGDGQQTTGSYPFILTPYFSKKWEIDIKDLRKLTADDFYNMWTSFSLSFEMKKDLMEQQQFQTQNNSAMKKIKKF